MGGPESQGSSVSHHTCLMGGPESLGLSVPRNKQSEVSTLLSETEDNRATGAIGKPHAHLVGSETLRTWKSPGYSIVFSNQIN
jgi:hypothetical protein